ncbi:MAG: flagellar hook-length control protein FliK [Brevundimonas sp.]
MSSAFALFASAPPASAGTPAAAPSGQDGEVADLFSSKLADAFQGLGQADAAKVETPQRTPGRLSLQTISTTELAAVAAEEDAHLALDLTAEAADEVAAVPASSELLPSNDDAEPADPAIAAADVVVAPQPAPQVIVPAPVQAPAPAPASDAPATDGVTETARLAPAGQIGQDISVADPASDLTADSVAAAARPVEATPEPSPARPAASKDYTPAVSAAPTSTTVVESALLTPSVALAPQPATMDTTAASPQSQPKSAEPARVQVERPAAAPLSVSSPSNQTATEAAVASLLTTPEKPAAKPGSNTAKAEVAEAVRLTDPSLPKPEVKITVQPATAAAQTVTAVQTAAVVSNLAVAGAVKAIETQAEAPQQNASDTDLPVIEATQSSQTAPTKGAATPPAPSTPLRSASDNTVPTSGARPLQDGSDTLATDHVAMADAASSMSQTRQDSLGQVAPATDGVTPAAVPLIDAAVAPLDPTTPIDTPAEVRALDGATTTTHTAASSLSRATIETTAHLAAQIARKLEGRSTRFDMVLTPEDLGRVDVSLEIGADGQLAARLAFDNPAAAAELRGRADELRRQLQDAGFQVANDSLDFTQRDTSSGGGFDRQQQQRQSLFAGAARLTAQADLSVTPPPGAWTNHSQTRDRVDVRV